LQKRHKWAVSVGWPRRYSRRAHLAGSVEVARAAMRTVEEASAEVRKAVVVRTVTGMAVAKEAAGRAAAVRAVMRAAMAVTDAGTVAQTRDASHRSLLRRLYSRIGRLRSPHSRLWSVHMPRSRRPPGVEWSGLRWQ